MTKEQALEKKLEQVKWQFPNHVVFEKDNKVYHFDPNNANEENIFFQTGLKVYEEMSSNVALYDPEHFKVDVDGDLVYKGAMTEKIPQPINLKKYDWLFYRCECETIDLSDWDFREVTSMYSAFSYCRTEVILLGDTNFSKCTDFRECFYCCDGLRELVLGNYKIPPEVNVVDMFSGCARLIGKYNRTEEELADIFKSGQWNSLQTVQKSKLSKLMGVF